MLLAPSKESERNIIAVNFLEQHLDNSLLAWRCIFKVADFPYIRLLWEFERRSQEGCLPSDILLLLFALFKVRVLCTAA